jgi:hypothetical protein
MGYCASTTTTKRLRDPCAKPWQRRSTADNGGYGKVLVNRHFRVFLQVRQLGLSEGDEHAHRE